jgi:hypothetical protein
MRAFGYEIRRVEEDLKSVILNKFEANAKAGLIQARVELKHHELLLEQCKALLVPNDEEQTELKKEIRLNEEAVERDKKSINNWETQIKAIKYERN